MMAFSNRTKVVFALVVVLVLAYVRIARSRNDSGLVGRKTDSQLKSGGETADTSHGEPVKGDKGNGSNPTVTGYKSNSVTTYDASSLVKSDAKSDGETANSEGKHVDSDVKPVKVVDNHEPNTTNANVAGKSNHNIDSVTGIGNCIKPEGTMRVVFSTSYLLPVNVRQM